MSVVALTGYSVAAVFDYRTRRVPNTLWVILTVVALATTATVAGILASIYLGTAGFISWYYGEIGGADVKGLIVLPLLLPHHWVASTGVALAVTAALLATGLRQEVPFFVPLLIGVVAALLLGLTINPLALLLE